MNSSSSHSIQELTHQVIGCAYTVHNTLGFGFLESVYEKSLLIELEKVGLSVTAQEAIKVHYESQVVGSFYADLFIDGRLIVELKSVSAPTVAHEVQLVNYLSATGIEDG